jgi:hypothetical protein
LNQHLQILLINLPLPLIQHSSLKKKKKKGLL